MRIAIFYFSQTGNTEKVAVELYSRFQALGHEVVPLTLADAAELPDAVKDLDLLGVGFPTFFGYPPPFIVDLLKRLRPVHGTSAFVFTTYGGATAGDSLYEAAAVLARKGYSILGGLKVQGSDSYPQGIELQINKGRPDASDLRAADEFAGRVLEAHESGGQLDPKTLASRTLFFAENRGKPRKALLQRMRKNVEGKITFDKSQCLFCVTCRDTCPTGSIRRGERLPEFSWKCIDGIRCFQCVRVCPGKALQVEFPRPLKDYEKYTALAADSPEEKGRLMIVAGAEG